MYIAAGGGIPAAAAAAADPYHYALDARQRELEMALHQRRHQLATQLQVEEEINCTLTAVVCDLRLYFASCAMQLIYL